jgi:hypothetical protein
MLCVLRKGIEIIVLRKFNLKDIIKITLEHRHQAFCALETTKEIEVIIYPNPDYYVLK